MGNLKAGNRDLIPSGRHTFELQLSYSFSLPKSGEAVLSLHQLCDVLYESELESQLWMLYDSNKRLLACGDAYPSKWSVKLEKGDYVVRAHVRHEKREYVERFQDTSLTVSSKLSSALTMDIYSSAGQAQVGGKKCGTVSVSPGRPNPIYVAPFAKEDVGKKVDVYNFKYILPEGSKKKEKEKDKGKKKAEDAAAYEEALRDCKISWLSKLGSQELYSELLKGGGESSVITSIHAARLANMLAAEAAEKKWMEKVKGQLMEALSAKGEGLLETGEQDQEKLLQIYTDLLKYTDVNDAKVFGFMWKLFRSRGLIAKALKLAVKQLEDKPSKELEGTVQDLASQLGWTHVVRVLEFGRPARFPADYQPF